MIIGTPIGADTTPPDDVADLQRALNQLLPYYHHSLIDVDHVVGPQTVAALDAVGLSTEGDFPSDEYLYQSIQDNAYDLTVQVMDKFNAIPKVTPRPGTPSGTVSPGRSSATIPGGSLTTPAPTWNWYLLGGAALLVAGALYWRHTQNEKAAQPAGGK